MAEKPKTPKKSTMIDVAQPGRSAPSASSRPIIVGNKPTVQDPMVNDKQNVQAGEQPVAVRRSAPQVIAPLSDAEKRAAENDTDTSTNADQAEQTPVEAPPVPATEPASEQPGSSDGGGSASGSGSDKNSGGKSSSIVDAVVDQASKNKDKKGDKKQAELEKRQAEVEKLIEEKKYFVQTSQVAKKQRKTRWAALLLVILLLVGAYLAIDAQVIKNDIQLPYEFFKEEERATPAPLPVSGDNDNAQKAESTDEESKEPANGQDAESVDGQMPAQISARDTERKIELKNLQQKLEAYFNDRGAYPTGAGWATSINATNDEITGPRGDAYTYESDGRSFTLRAQLENASDPDAADGFYVINSLNE